MEEEKRLIEIVKTNGGVHVLVNTVRSFYKLKYGAWGHRKLLSRFLQDSDKFVFERRGAGKHVVSLAGNVAQNHDEERKPQRPKRPPKRQKPSRKNLKAKPQRPTRSPRRSVKPERPPKRRTKVKRRKVSIPRKFLPKSNSKSTINQKKDQPNIAVDWTSITDWSTYNRVCRNTCEVIRNDGIKVDNSESDCLLVRFPWTLSIKYQNSHGDFFSMKNNKRVNFKDVVRCSPWFSFERIDKIEYIYVNEIGRFQMGWGDCFSRYGDLSIDPWLEIISFLDFWDTWNLRKLGYQLLSSIVQRYFSQRRIRPEQFSDILRKTKDSNIPRLLLEWKSVDTVEGSTAVLKWCLENYKLEGSLELAEECLRIGAVPTNDILFHKLEKNMEQENKYLSGIRGMEIRRLITRKREGVEYDLTKDNYSFVRLLFHIAAGVRGLNRDGDYEGYYSWSYCRPKEKDIQFAKEWMKEFYNDERLEIRRIWDASFRCMKYYKGKKEIHLYFIDLFKDFFDDPETKEYAYSDFIPFMLELRGSRTDGAKNHQEEFLLERARSRSEVDLKIIWNYLVFNLGEIFFGEDRRIRDSSCCGHYCLSKFMLEDVIPNLDSKVRNNMVQEMLEALSKVFTERVLGNGDFARNRKVATELICSLWNGMDPETTNSTLVTWFWNLCLLSRKNDPKKTEIISILDKILSSFGEYVEDEAKKSSFFEQIRTKSYEFAQSFITKKFLLPEGGLLEGGLSILLGTGQEDGKSEGEFFKFVYSVCDSDLKLPEVPKDKIDLIFKHWDTEALFLFIQKVCETDRDGRYVRDFFKRCCGRSVELVQKMIEHYEELFSWVQEEFSFECLSISADNDDEIFFHIFKDLASRKVELSSIFSSPELVDIVNLSIDIGRIEIFDFVMDLFIKQNVIQDPSVHLSHAVRKGKKVFLVRLVEQYFPLTDIYKDHQWCLREAVENNHPSIVSYLLENEKVDPTADNNYCFRYAMKKQYRRVVEILMRDSRAAENVIRKPNTDKHREEEEEEEGEEGPGLLPEDRNRKDMKLDFQSISNDLVVLKDHHSDIQLFGFKENGHFRGLFSDQFGKGQIKDGIIEEQVNNPGSFFIRFTKEYSKTEGMKSKVDDVFFEGVGESNFDAKNKNPSFAGRAYRFGGNTGSSDAIGTWNLRNVEGWEVYARRLIRSTHCDAGAILGKGVVWGSMNMYPTKSEAKKLENMFKTKFCGQGFTFDGRRMVCLKIDTYDQCLMARDLGFKKRGICCYRTRKGCIVIGSYNEYESMVPGNCANTVYKIMEFLQKKKY